MRNLNAELTEAVAIQTSYSLPFSNITDTMRTRAHDAHILFLPTSTTFAVDAIIAPRESGGASTDPVIVVEASMTNPRESGRVNKVLSWFKPTGVIPQLTRVYPARTIIVLLCCGGGTLLPPGATASRYKEIIEVAASVKDATVQVVVADRDSLEKLQIVF